MITGGRRVAAVVGTSALLLAGVVASAAPVAAATPTPADCTIFVVDGVATGTSGDDVICGTEGDDVILGGGGSDTIFGLGGNDYIDAGAGADWVSGGYGADDIELGPGDDYANGGPGSDRLWGEDGLDDLNGGSGDDALTGGAGADDIDGGPGVDYYRKATGDTTTSCYFDTSRPSLVGVAVGTPTMDTSAAARVLAVRVHVKDTGTGVAYLGLSFYRHLANGPWANERALQAWTDGTSGGCTSTGHAPTPTTAGDTTACLVSGSPRDGIYELRTLVPRWAAKGTYILSTVQLRDMAGNTRYLTVCYLSSAHLSVNFKQVGTGDPVAPTVRSVKVVTPSINTSGADRVIGVEVRATDATSGVGYISLGWARTARNDSGQIIQYLDPQTGMGFSYDAPPCTAGIPTVAQLTSGAVLSACKVSGGVHDGVWRAWGILPRWAGQGTYELISVGSSDRAGNTDYLSDGDISAFNIASHFYQAGAGDEVAPYLASASVVTSSVSTGTDPVQIKVRVRVKDAVSGVGSVFMDFQPASDTGQSLQVTGYSDPCSPTNYEACRVSGTVHDGIVELVGWLPAHAASGTWKPWRVEVYDRAGNLMVKGDPGLPRISFTNS